MTRVEIRRPAPDRGRFESDVVAAFDATDHQEALSLALLEGQFDDTVYVKDTALSGTVTHTYYALKNSSGGLDEPTLYRKTQSIVPAS